MNSILEKMGASNYMKAPEAKARSIAQRLLNYYGLVFDLDQLHAFRERDASVKNVVVSKVSDGGLSKPKNNRIDIDNYMNTFTCSEERPTYPCHDEWWSWF